MFLGAGVGIRSWIFVVVLFVVEIAAGGGVGEEMGAFEDDRRFVAGLRADAVLAEGIDFLARLLLKTGSCANSSPSSERLRFLPLGWVFLMMEEGGCVGASLRDSLPWSSSLFFAATVASVNWTFLTVEGAFVGTSS